MNYPIPHRDMTKESYSSSATGSLTDRIKRNIHYVQRTESALDSFTKR